jgi:hypothetical protein
MLRLIHVFAFTGAFAAVALVGCNAVLGIDEAQSRDDASSQSTVQVIPVPGCENPETSCATCVSGSKAFGECMGNHACRKALDGYRACLGSKCNGATCFDTLLAGPGQTVAEFVRGECPACESNKPLASMCDLFCACMEQTLPPPTTGAPVDGLTCESFLAALPWTVASMAECKDSCEALAKADLASVNCRWGHCELAANGEARSHCGHAIDDSICPRAAALNPDCRDRNLPGWACEQNQDCCSNRCLSRICAK